MMARELPVTLALLLFLAGGCIDFARPTLDLRNQSSSPIVLVWGPLEIPIRAGSGYSRGLGDGCSDRDVIIEGVDGVELARWPGPICDDDDLFFTEEGTLVLQRP